MLKKLFSIEKKNLHYIVRFFGLKLKIRNTRKQNEEFRKMQLQLKRLQIPSIYNTNLTESQKIWFLSRKFYEEVGYFPDFKKPKSFNEKINYLKLNYYNPLEKRIIDKYEFKGYIETILGPGYTIPLIGVYDDVNDIDFNALPERFVIKITTLGSGEGVEIIKDKSNVNIDRLKYKLNNLLQVWNSIYYYCLSAGYKDIKPRIIIEEYMPIREGKAIEYKMFCFHGEMKFCLVECDFFGKNPRRALYDREFKTLPFKIGKIEYSSLSFKPDSYNRMVELAEKLAADFPHVRVDFYDVNGKIYVGEMTFTSAGGFSIFTPSEWDFKIGEYLDLNKLNPEYVNIVNELK